MADLVIDRGAYRFGKAAVVEGGGDRLQLIDDVVVADVVQFAGRDTGFHLRLYHGQNLCGELAGDPHLDDFFGRLDRDGHCLVFHSISVIKPDAIVP